jgi:hypothetical protein
MNTESIALNFASTSVGNRKVIAQMDIKDALIAALMVEVGKEASERVVNRIAQLASEPEDVLHVLDASMRAVTFVDETISQQDMKVLHVFHHDDRMRMVIEGLQRVGFSTLLANHLGDDPVNINKYTGDEAVMLALTLALGPQMSEDLAGSMDEHLSKEVAGLLRGWIVDARRTMGIIEAERREGGYRDRQVPITTRVLQEIKKNLHPDWTDESVAASSKRVEELKQSTETDNKGMDISDLPPDLQDLLKQLGVKEAFVFRLNKPADEVRAPKAEKKLPLGLLNALLLGGLPIDGTPEMPEPVMRAPQRNITLRQLVEEKFSGMQAYEFKRRVQRDGTEHLLDLKVAVLREHLNSPRCTYDEREALRFIEGVLLRMYDTWDAALADINSPYEEPTPRCECSRCKRLLTLRLVDIYIETETGRPVIVKTN